MKLTQRFIQVFQEWHEDSEEKTGWSGSGWMFLLNPDIDLEKYYQMYCVVDSDKYGNPIEAIFVLKSEFENEHLLSNFDNCKFFNVNTSDLTFEEQQLYGINFFNKLGKWKHEWFEEKLDTNNKVIQQPFHVFPHKELVLRLEVHNNQMTNGLINWLYDNKNLLFGCKLLTVGLGGSYLDTNQVNELKELKQKFESVIGNIDNDVLNK